MAYEKEIEILEAEWSPDDGFFWRIRQGQFSVHEFHIALKKIADISVPEDATLPRRLVSLLWYIPSFMQWQMEWVCENGGEGTEYQRAIGLMTTEIERLLGVP